MTESLLGFDPTTAAAPRSHLGGSSLVLYGLHHPPSPVATRRVAPPRPGGRRAELRRPLGAGDDADAVGLGAAEQDAGLGALQTAQGVPSARGGAGGFTSVGGAKEF